MIMNAGGETADQVIKMSLEGIEVAANIAIKAGGSTARSLAAMLYAIITDQKKVKGKTRLNNLLKSGKELKVFAIRNQDLKLFCEEAKRYGVLYSVLKEKNNKDGICDIMVRAEDAAKISRIVDKFELATIDTKAIKESILAERENATKDVPVMNDEEHDKLVKMLMDSTTQSKKEELDIQVNPQEARTQKENKKAFEHSSKNAKSKRNKKTSVHKKLENYKKEIANANKSKQRASQKSRNQSYKRKQSQKRKQSYKRKQTRKSKER